MNRETHHRALSRVETGLISFADVRSSMSLEVPTPEAPTIYDETRGDEYEPDAAQRANLQAYFETEDAWVEGFTEWATTTPLTEREYAIIDDLKMIRDFDFYWDPETEHVEYEAPEIPDTWETQDVHRDLDTWSTVSAINEELDALGRSVADLLTDYYVDWEAEDELFGEQFNARDDVVPESESEQER